MGVFSKWSVLEHVENRLDLQIINNPTFPFEKDESDPNVLVYKDRPPEFYISCVVSVCCAIIITVWVSIVLLSSMGLSQGLVFPIALLLYFLYRGTQTIRVRVYKVNVHAGWYKFYIGGQQIQEGKLHNFYLRLREKSSTGFPYYEIVLNGYKVSCVSISGFSKNIRKMRELAKGISKRLSINYFDYKDISPHHLVHWEKPADITASTPSLLEDHELPQMKDNVMPQLVIPPLSASQSQRMPPPSPPPPSPPRGSSPLVPPRSPSVPERPPPAYSDLEAEPLINEAVTSSRSKEVQPTNKSVPPSTSLKAVSSNQEAVSTNRSNMAVHSSSVVVPTNMEATKLENLPPPELPNINSPD